MTLIAGVDEAGRGAWAGNVVAAAVILPENYALPGLDDSKKLTPKRREKLCAAIFEQAVAVAYAQIPAAEIDRINILQATLKAMQLAVNGLAVRPDKVLIDGNQMPKLEVTAETIIGGDHLFPAISAASIIAKVMRDHQLQALDFCYPNYQFGAHKGYGTKVHQLALARYGVLPYHRKSYAPIARLLTSLR